MDTFAVPEVEGSKFNTTLSTSEKTHFFFENSNLSRECKIFLCLIENCIFKNLIIFYLVKICFFVEKYEVKVWVRLSDPFKPNGVN